MKHKKDFMIGYNQLEAFFFFIDMDYIKNTINGSTIYNDEGDYVKDLVIDTDNLILTPEELKLAIENNNDMRILYYIIMGKNVYPKESIGETIDHDLIIPLYEIFKNDNTNSEFVSSLGGNIVYLNYTRIKRFIKNVSE